MTEAARETGVVTQMGNQLASSLQERMAVELLRAGAVGKIKRAHAFSKKNWGDDKPIPEGADAVPGTLDWDLWCGPARKRPYRSGYYHPSNWRKRQDYGTGCLGDMGCHIWNPLYRGLGLTAPISVKASVGVPNPDNWATREHVRYFFPGNELTEGETIEVTWYSGSEQPPEAVLAVIPENLRVDGGTIYEGTEGLLLAPHGNTRPFLFPMEKFTGYQYPKLEPRDHYHEYIDCIIGKQQEAPISNFLYAGPATESVLLGCVASLFPDQQLEWDAEACRVTNLEEANAHLSIDYREGWQVLDASSVPAEAAGV
jgi:predicted dehydrogenase